MLAKNNTKAVIPTLYFARLGLRLTKEVTLYTNGSEKLASELIRTLEEHPYAITVNITRVIKLIEGSNRSEITF